MKIVTVIFLFIIFSNSVCGQMKFNSSQREVCKMLSEDQIECKVVLEDVIFEIDYDEKNILQIGEGRKANFKIDSKKFYENSESFSYDVISTTGQKIRLIFGSDFIKMQSIEYPETFINFKIKY